MAGGPAMSSSRQHNDTGSSKSWREDWRNLHRTQDNQGSLVTHGSKTSSSASGRGSQEQRAPSATTSRLGTPAKNHSSSNELCAAYVTGFNAERLYSSSDLYNCITHHLKKHAKQFYKFGDVVSLRWQTKGAYVELASPKDLEEFLRLDNKILFHGFRLRLNPWIQLQRSTNSSVHINDTSSAGASRTTSEIITAASTPRSQSSPITKTVHSSSSSSSQATASRSPTAKAKAPSSTTDIGRSCAMEIFVSPPPKKMTPAKFLLTINDSIKDWGLCPKGIDKPITYCYELGAGKDKDPAAPVTWKMGAATTELVEKVLYLNGMNINFTPLQMTPNRSHYKGPKKPKYANFTEFKNDYFKIKKEQEKENEAFASKIDTGVSSASPLHEKGGASPAPSAAAPLPLANKTKDSFATVPTIPPVTTSETAKKGPAESTNTSTGTAGSSHKRNLHQDVHDSVLSEPPTKKHRIPTEEPSPQASATVPPEDLCMDTRMQSQIIEFQCKLALVEEQLKNERARSKDLQWKYDESKQLLQEQKAKTKVLEEKLDDIHHRYLSITQCLAEQANDMRHERLENRILHERINAQRDELDRLKGGQQQQQQPSKMEDEIKKDDDGLSCDI